MSGSEDGPTGGVEARVPGGRLRSWLLLDGHRWQVAGLMGGVVVLVLLVPALAAPEFAHRALTTGDPVETLFQALVAGIVTGVTLVVTIAQLVLSQELGAVGDQRERMRRAMAFQEDVESTLGRGVSPPQPAAFLRWMVAGVRDRARELGRAVEGAGGELAEWIGTLVRRIEEDSDRVTNRLEGAEFGTFQVVRSALEYDYSWKIHLGRRLRAVHGGELSPEAGEALEALLQALEFFGPSREHFKTLYFQWELTNLSREIIYAAVPALAVSVATLLGFTAPTGGEATLIGLRLHVWIVLLCIAVSLVPFALLLSYMLRITTVTQRTLAIGPFVLRETVADGELVRGLDGVR